MFSRGLGVGTEKGPDPASLDPAGCFPPFSMSAKRFSGFSMSLPSPLQALQVRAAAFVPFWETPSSRFLPGMARQDAAPPKAGQRTRETTKIIGDFHRFSKAGGGGGAGGCSSGLLVHPDWSVLFPTFDFALPAAGGGLHVWWTSQMAESNAICHLRWRFLLTGRPENSKKPMP